MKTDTYTKIILTVIAVNLTIVTLKPLMAPNSASAAVTTKQTVNTQAYSLVPVNKDGSINVKMNNDGPIEVKLVGIDHALYLNWDAIKVKSDN